MSTTVAFLPQSDRWSAFYQRFDINVDPETANESGWLNFNCPLPTHPHIDHDKKGAINLFSGSYRCWNETCRDEYTSRVRKPSTSTILTPREFLIVAHNFTNDSALAAVESYRASDIFVEGSNRPGAFGHNDDAFVSSFSPIAPDVADEIKRSQTLLRPDLDIVVEYATSRGLEFETLRLAGVGYLPQDDENGQEECLLLPYTLNGEIVGVRGRTLDGRKGGLKGSYTTLFNLDSIEIDSRTCIVVEGETDTLYTSQILRHRGLQIPVVGTPGVGFKPEWRRHLEQFSRIIAIPQADTAAQRFARNITEAFPQKAEIVNLPWRARQHGKDISDFCRSSPQNEELLVQLLGVSTSDTEPLPYVLDDSTLITLADAEIPWVIPNLLERGTKTLIVGDPKTRKTWLALEIGYCCINQEPFMGVEDWKPTAPDLKVMLIEEEGSVNRLGDRWKRMQKVPSGRFFAIHRQGVRLDNPDSVSKLKEAALGVRPDVIIFDPYASLHLQDENAVQGTMLVQSAISSVLKALPQAAVVIIHHTTKHGGDVRGSGALWGAVDTQIRIRKTGSSTIELEINGRDLPTHLEDLMFMFDETTFRHVPVEVTPSVRVTGRQTDDRGQTLLNLMAHQSIELITSDEAATLLGVSEYSARFAINQLADDGRLEFVSGGGRSGPRRYRIAEQAPELPFDLT